MHDLLVPLSFFQRTGMQISRQKKKSAKGAYGEVFSRTYHQDKFKFCWQAYQMVRSLADLSTDRRQLHLNLSDDTYEKRPRTFCRFLFFPWKSAYQVSKKSSREQGGHSSLDLTFWRFCQFFLPVPGVVRLVGQSGEGIPTDELYVSCHDSLVNIIILVEAQTL